RISFTKDAKHMPACLKHMSKITPNNTHRFDDVADTLVDAVNIALIEKSLNHVAAPDAALSSFSKLQSSNVAALNAIMKQSKGNIW
ncbi:MAG TPA: hypothetical protein VIJ14_00365, partial [Rhabdochlamydiaceae bacterium]